MKLAACLIENRYNPTRIIERHEPYLPGFEILHFSPAIKTLNDYNRYMTSMYFWNQVKEYDKILIFQHDSEILRPGIKDYLHYDYIGAPWKFMKRGGNGGLSLRDVEKSIKTIKHVEYNPAHHGYEDVYFSQFMDGNVATRGDNHKFSVETIFELGTWGVHAIDNWLTKEQCKRIRNQYS